MLVTNLIRFHVEDRVNSSEIKEFTLTVVNDNLPPKINTSSLPNAESRIAYNLQIDAIDPENGELTYNLRNTPEGMTINTTTGVISWQPVDELASENLPVWLEVTDEAGLTTAKLYTIHITQFVNRAPIFVPAYRPPLRNRWR